MPATRRCDSCGLDKSVRGVWYLVAPGRRSGSAFRCESCFRASHAPMETVA